MAVARLSGDCHALQRDIFRKLGNHAHTGTVIDLHIAERNIFAGRHIGGRITSRMMAKDDDMTRRIALKTLQVAGSLQRHLHQAFLQLFPDSVVGIRPDIKARLVRSLGGLAFFRVHFHPERNLLAEIFPCEKDPLMGYIIRKALFVDPKLHGGAVHGNNRSLGVSRTLVVDGKALQRNVLAVLEIEGQKLRMENEIAVFSANSKVRAVREVESDPFDRVLVVVGDAQSPLKGEIRVKMIGSLLKKDLHRFLVFAALLQNAPKAQHVHTVFLSGKNSIVSYMKCFHRRFPFFFQCSQIPRCRQRGIFILFILLRNLPAHLLRNISEGKDIPEGSARW